MDGNADGAAGDDFVRQLTRSSSGARTVSLPDFARGPDQIVNLPANAIGIPVTISEAGGVTRIDLELSFDPALLVITAVQAGPDLPVGWTIVPDFSVSGKVSWVATGPALAAGADKSLFVLTASVPLAAPYLASHVLDWTRVVLNNGEIAAEGNDAFHKVAFFGDTGANRGYDSFDAALLLSVSSGLFSGFRPYRLTDPTIIGDIDFDGVIGPSDALLLAGHVVGFFLPQIPLLTGSVGPTDVIGEDPILSFATTANLVPGQSGETVLQIGLAFPDPNGINAMDITLRFDPLVFQFTAGDNPITIDGTSFFADYFSNSVNADGNTVYRIDTQNNLVIISLSSSNRLGAATDATRNVLKLRLPVKSDSPLGECVAGVSGRGVHGPRQAQQLPQWGGLVLTTMDGTFRVGPDNLAPSNVTFANTTTSLAESASTTSAVKVADIVYADDALGNETITLTGADAEAFEVFGGTQLRLKANTPLNFETKAIYTVTVNIDDPTLGTGVDASNVFTLTITDVNEAPTSVTFANTTTSLAESASTASAVKVADIVYADDALGIETITLTGADAGAFEVFGGTQLRLKANTPLNFETKASYTVTVNVDDPTLGTGVDASSVFTLTITDINEAPTAVTLVNRSTAVSANLDTSSPVKVAELSVTDDALGSETITLTGPDASLFEVDPAGTQLRLKRGPCCGSWPTRERRLSA